MSDVVGIRILVDLPGDRDRDLYGIHGDDGILLHEQGRVHEEP
jgi:hypothetical protein